MEVCCTALDARWRRPRRIKELETLKQSVAATAAVIAQACRHPHGVIKHNCGAGVDCIRQLTVATAHEAKEKRKSAEACAPAAIPLGIEN